MHELTTHNFLVCITMIAKLHTQEITENASSTLLGGLQIENVYLQLFEVLEVWKCRSAGRGVVSIICTKIENIPSYK
jgi:hypothetical protein